MAVGPLTRKVLLGVHLAASVGWLGAVIAYLALDIAVALSTDAGTVRAAWMAMGLVAIWVIVPLSVATLVTGVAIGLATPWGIVRHWWVLISLVLTALAVVVLLIEVQVISRSAALAMSPMTSDERLLSLSSTLPHSIGGLVILVLVHWLNVLKPRGLTPYGWRKRNLGT